MARVQITANVKPELVEALRQAAERDSRSMSSYIEMVLREHLKRQAKERGK